MLFRSYATGSYAVKLAPPSYVARACMLLCLLGCATILEGPNQTIKLHCNPSHEVSVLVDGEAREFKMGVVTLDKRRDAHFVTFAKDGYQPTTIAFNREINPIWPVLDLLWGPAVPLAWFVDWYTGALFRIDPRDIHVVLRQKGGEPNEGK